MYRENGRSGYGYLQSLPILFVYSSEVSIEPWLSVKCFLAAFHGTLVLLRLAMDGLDVH